MPTKLITSPVTGNNNNSYVTYDEAVAYFEDRLYTDAWDALNPGDVDTDENPDPNRVKRENALITATHIIDTSFAWIGSIRRYDGIEENLRQRLQFPRYGLRDYDGYYIDDKTIPRKVKQAVCEMALVLLEGNPKSDTPLDSGISEIKVDTIQLKFNKDNFTGDQQFDGNGIPMKIVSLLREFIDKSTNVNNGVLEVVRK